MPSPFLGMDPYLETADLWPLFQHTFVDSMAKVIGPGLADQYRACVHQRRYGVQTESVEEYVEVIGRNDEKLVTLLEIVSPSNKTTTAGRDAYLNTRQQARAKGANIVEIDLVLQGQPTLEYCREGLPPWDYAVTLVRGEQPERYEIYTATLQTRLPRLRVPLASSDRDIVLDLGIIMKACYDQGSFASRVNYGDPPAFLRDRIAIAAYHLWQQDGCPFGRDKEHWFLAIERLGECRKRTS